ncbi:MAG: Eco57I restriction-modification methylase domain-containing protein, partial [Planctomycetes bacterium]|nr:Eco57I restriction-modification methylase domain-containing protein [Planctomycetota bacterium]
MLRYTSFDGLAKPSRDREGADNTTGFDAVIGNPPYDVLEKDRKDANWPHVALSSYVRSNLGYHDALGGKLNLFRFFLVRSMDLVAPSGAFGMIIPLAFLGDISCARTRRYIIRSLDHTVGDCFPQKDRPSRRVFRNAKLSTLVLTGTRRDPSTRTPESIEIRVYPWSIFSDRARTCSVSLLDAALLDEKNIPIPLVDQRDWDLCKRIHGAPDVAHFRNIDGVSITRGEINQTVYRKFITDDPNMKRLLKGVEVGRYQLHDTLSQG